MTRPRIALLAFLVAASPAVVAHAPVGAPNPECDPRQDPHDYVGGSGLLLTGFSVVGDGCAEPTTDHDDEFGYGAAFLPADHHGSTVCVVDEVLLDQVRFVVGADGNGDGLVTSVPPDGLTPVVKGCVTAGFPAGADGGWWVFVHAPATAGHVHAP
ncbi:MAG TPA: hypothetical protein VNX21_07600 [Candidatus Thermoplasmatota archaeon]|nr:hypothetical protein [Candidatus Thermoplasmatota archaeon]